MVRGNLEFILLLFRCLFQFYVLNGVFNASTSLASLVEITSADDLSELMETGKERHFQRIISSEKTKQAAMSNGGTHNMLTGTRTSFVMKLSKNKVVHRESQDKMLKQELRKRQMIVPGYYQAECSEKKPCKEGMYCNVLYCEKCHKLNVACNNNEQCCKGTVCTFGRCEKKSKGDPGTFCEKDTDCKDACCVLEPTINSHLPICKPMLDEYHQCAAILYRKIWIGDKPDCGPCKSGLECTQKGIFASHEICMKPE